VKYQYKIVCWSHQYGNDGSITGSSAFADELNKLGAEGWHVVASDFGYALLERTYVVE